MRIIAGEFRNLRLSAPDGQSTRPTAERAREALFNRLDNGPYRARLKGGVMADLFAGSGAVGLEALSRGAARAVFVERDRTALTALKANIAHLKVGERADIITGDAAKLPTARVAADIVFIDPPYHQGLGVAALASAQAVGWLAPDALVIIQHHPKEALELPPGFQQTDSRRYGANQLTFIERE